MILTGAIFLMGFATVALALAVAAAFGRQSNFLKGDSRKLSKSISWQLVGESVIGLGSLVFAYAAYQEWLEGWSIELQSSIRFTMFLATSITTLHLWSVVRTLNR